MFKVEANLKEIAAKQLTQRAARKEGAARRPVTTVNCQALHGLQFRAKVEGHSFISDEGDEAGGHDAGPAPLRYFLAGMMMCHQVWCVKSSAVADVQLDKLEGEISGFVEAGGNEGGVEKERGFDLIKYTVTILSPNPAAAVQSIVEAATKRCPAFVSASRAIPIEVTILHNEKNLGAKTYDRRK
ncbi:MAG: OsmC family peroxiredoxin [Deltaproteobacteria bacterium]|nr:OsmC family peroxiredoxin [Deltaproteobacteria bacterium]